MGTYKLSYTGQEVNSILGTAKGLPTKVDGLLGATNELSAKVADLEGALDSLPSSPEGSPIAGIVYPFAGDIVPEGFLICDGEAYSRDDYAELFEAIGTTYGEGDGATTFNVPDLQTRVPVGAGVDYELGEVGGEETHTLTVAEMPSHLHSWKGVNTGSDTTSGSYNIALFGIDSADAYQAQGKGGQPAGGDQPHNNMQPYTVVNYIISTGKSADARPMTISETTVQSTAVAGMVYPFAGEGDPEGFLLCDGSEYSRTEYAKLFDAIGTTYGSGDGSTTFNVPNLESRVIIGESDKYALGEIGGEETHKLTVSELPANIGTFEALSWKTEVTSGAFTKTQMFQDITAPNGSNAGSSSYNLSGGDQPHNNMQPYVVMRYFISTGEGGVVSGGSGNGSGITPADYIVEYGSDGFWTWRKWSSGVFECWNTNEYAPAIPVGYTAADLELPFELLNSDYRVQAKINATIATNNIDSAEKVAVTPRTRSASGFTLGIWNAHDYERNLAIDVYVIGAWKELSSGGTASGAVYGINPADYVVEWGQTDGWYWEKYASGKAECWAVLFEENNEPYSTWNNMPFRYTPMWEFPIEFIDVPSVSYAGYIGSGYAIDARAEATKDWVRLFFATSSTGSQQVEAHIQAKGFWKDAPTSGSKAIGHFDNATVENELNVEGTLTVDGREYGVNKVLWSGEMYVTTSQTATLSEAVSAQPNGIVLLWSRYQDGAARDWEFSTFFVPKQFVASFPSCEFFCGHRASGRPMNKIIRISDTSITGASSDNGSSVTVNGENFYNDYNVLRAVIGV